MLIINYSVHYNDFNLIRNKCISIEFKSTALSTSEIKYSKNLKHIKSIEKMLENG